MKVLIEDYRGFEIYFETENSKFQCIATEDSTKESHSFDAVKKFVDDYKKQNETFKPFEIATNPKELYSSELNVKKVIGIRKDGRFVCEGIDGNKEQISDWDLKRYVLLDESNKQFFSELLEMLNKHEKLKKELSREREKKISSMSFVTLAEYKQKIQ